MTLYGADDHGGTMMVVKQGCKRAPGRQLMYAQVLSLILIWVTAGTLAWAQERTGRIRHSKPRTSARLTAANVHGEGTAARVGFDIPSKPLPQALTDFSLATGVQVLYTVDQPFGL